jgi:hypothetical protein
MIFVALDAKGLGLQHFFQLQRQHKDVHGYVFLFGE